MQKGFLFKSLRVVVVLAVSLAIAFTLLKLRPKAEKQQRPPQILLVDVLPARSQDIPVRIDGFGTVTPRETLQLSAEVPGRVIYLHPDVKAGNFIAAETVLMRIDPRTYQLEAERSQVQINQAQADLRRLDQEVANLQATINIATSDVKLAKAELTRLTKLIKKKVVAQTTFDSAEQRYLQSLERLQNLQNQLALTTPNREALIAKRDMARVMLQQARLQVEKTRITIPFDGWILEKHVEAGQHVKVGAPLGSAYRSGHLDIEVQIPAKDAAWFPPPSPDGRLPMAEIRPTSGNRSTVWKGTVARAKAQLDSKTRTLPIIVEVDLSASSNRQGGTGHRDDSLGIHRLRPGMFVKVSIVGRQLKGVFSLPRHVVYDDREVYLFDNGRLKIQPINVLRTYQDAVIVDKGLTNGDLIIQSPLSAPVDGMKVRTN